MAFLDKIFGTYSEKEIKRIKPLVDKVLNLEDTYSKLSNDDLKNQTNILKDRLNNGETLDDILPDAFAVCREVSYRVLNMKHFPVQIIGGIILHKANIAEMRTGEGKTLVATLPVYLNALSGKGVHVVTVNDYLAKRDSEWMGKIYKFLGLSVGLVINGIDNETRRNAYLCDITYGTNNEFGFDYLRDNMVIYKKNMVQRGHNYAIVDEVDSILIDEARTPLIISGQGDKSTDMYTKANQFARRLKCAHVNELDDKKNIEDTDSENYVEADYIVDDKAKTCTLTKDGIKKAESYFQIDNLANAENIELQHHIQQAIKANGVMKLDVDYVVRDGEVVIVDEFTGRLMIGRRYNEGLHQAIEAKEGVTVARESKTLASITFQNYFRMYNKLSGMTGTALTEESEFLEIYKLPVVTIPTNKPNARIDHNDSVYKTENGKYNAVIEQIIKCHEKGQPVLVGTISIEKSEYLSKMLKKRGVKHEVLNAKYHEKEAEIISQAGKKGAVTIATNMAGRGTDIVLGGNAEQIALLQLKKEGYDELLITEANSYSNTDNEEIIAIRHRFEDICNTYKSKITEEAEEIRKSGGLFIIGTERHESRRIDNQLRGRSGRQGDNGETCFYLSLEDDLMRLFGGERMQNIMNTLGVEEDMPIENKLISKNIESAQRKIEGRNFSIRKNVLQYDDVMNSQREIIYGQRSKVLEDGDVSSNVRTMVKESIEMNCAIYLSGENSQEWNFDSLRNFYLGWLTTESDFKYSDEEFKHLKSSDISDNLIKRAYAILDKKEEKYGSSLMREIERTVLLRSVDTQWMEHIDNMEELRKGIYLRGYAQRDPVIEYRVEGFEMFDAMVDTIKEDTARKILTVEISNKPIERKQVATITGTGNGNNSPAVKKPVKVQKIGRNDPCPCGSGKKYKKCCGANL